MVSTAPLERVHRVLRAGRDRDPLAISAELNCGATELGLTRCVDDLILPARRALQGLHGAGRLDARQEVLATEAIRTWLSNRRSFGPPPRPVKPVLLSCGPRDRDVVVLESLAVLLHEHGTPCRVLGSRISTFTLAIAVQATDAAAVVLMSADSRGRRSAVESLLAVDALGIPLFYGGEAFGRGYSRRQVPGRYLGEHLGHACQLVADRLTPAAGTDAPARWPSSDPVVPADVHQGGTPVRQHG